MAIQPAGGRSGVPRSPEVPPEVATTGLKIINNLVEMLRAAQVQCQPTGSVPVVVADPPRQEKPEHMDDNEESLWASPLGESLCALLRENGGWMTKEKIIQELSEADSRVGPILWEYVQRRILESEPRLGYRYRRIHVPAARE